MRKSGWIGLATAFVLSWLCCTCLWGRPTTAREAEKAVVGWLKADPKPLGTSLGRHVREVETFTDVSGEAIHYIVYLQPSGFVIVPADDLVEPIIGFVQGDRFDPSPENSLGALVTDDLTKRIAGVRTGSAVRIMAEESFERDTQTKWRHLIDLAEDPKDRVAATALGMPSLSDVRVAPLVKSKWGQAGVSTACPSTCYNYYTPNNYVCGCSATALAQLMRYHEYPTSGIGAHECQIRVDSVGRTASTRGGDGSGGPYKWDLMPYEPNCDTTEAQRQAIGALCYDAGVSVHMGYSAGGSGADTRNDKDALTMTLQYGNAVVGYNNESDIGPGLTGMINPNLDARHPVILEVYPGGGGHDIVCDGYGYNSSTLYYHVNMGWLGIDDAWYNLPNIDPAITPIRFTYVRTCIYSIQVTKVRDGEIISGRVLDHNGEPMAHVALYAKTGSEIVAETETDSQGIYAFDCLQSNTAYAVNAVLKGYGFNRHKVTTGISRDNSAVSGNVWGVDFVGLLGDFNGDQIVDMRDLSVLAQYWGQDEASVDIAPGPSGDYRVDYKDLAIFAEYWLKEVPVPAEPGLIAHWKLDETEGTVAHNATGEPVYNATLYGDPSWQPEGGRIGGALAFDGKDDRGSSPFVVNPAEGPFSVFAWVKGGAPGQVVLSQEKGADWLMADATGGTLTTQLRYMGRFAGAPLTSQAVIVNGDWHRVGLTWDGSHRTLYVDDVEVARDTQASLGASVGGLYMGAGSTLAPGTFWFGLIDDVRVYDQVVKP